MIGYRNRIGAVALAAFAFSGCAAASAESATPPALLDQHRQDLVLIQQQSFQQEMWDAMQSAVQRCVQDRGLPYTPEPFFREPLILTGPALLPGDDLDYGLDTWDPDDEPGFLDITDEQVDALLGDEDIPGCFDVGQTNDAVVKASSLREQVVGAEELLFEILRVEPDYQRAVQSWSDCVASEGLDFPDRERLYAWLIAQDPSTRLETAPIDDRCLAQSGLRDLIDSYRLQHLGAAYKSL